MSHPRSSSRRGKPAGDAPALPSPTRAGRVALVGRPNVGKSTLFNALLGEPMAITSPHPQTTRTMVRGVVTRDDAQFVLLDTPGVHSPRNRLGHHMNESVVLAADGADATVFLVEAPRPGTFAGPADADLEVLASLPARPTVLAINKIDRVEDKAALLPFIAAFAERRPDFRATVPISARRESGLDRLLGELRDLVPEQPWLYEPDTLSDQPVRFFVAEFVREQILRKTRQEVPHGVAVVVDAYDESRRIPRIEATIHVTREAHKKILIGAKGSMLKSIGIAARARVEAMLSGRVDLRLQVRATPDWMDSDARLRELGYGEDDEA
jgi:GTP-binding protein Era